MGRSAESAIPPQQRCDTEGVCVSSVGSTVVLTAWDALRANGLVVIIMIMKMRMRMMIIIIIKNNDDDNGGGDDDDEKKKKNNNNNNNDYDDDDDGNNDDDDDDDVPEIWWEGLPSLRFRHSKDEEQRECVLALSGVPLSSQRGMH